MARSRAAFLFAALVIASAAPAAAQEDESGFVQVYATPTLGAVVQELVSRYLVANPSAPTAQVSFGGPSGLLDRLSAVGPVDVVAFDDPAQLDVARSANLLGAEPPRVFARSRLTLATPMKSGSNKVNELKDLASAGVRWASLMESSPLSVATTRVFDRASALADYGPTFRAQAERNLLLRVGTIDDLLHHVADGDVDAAVVLTADVTPDARKQLRVIDLPDNVNEFHDYSVAVLNGPNTVGAQTFVSYLQSPFAQAILVRYGFVAAPVVVPEDDRASIDVGGLVETPRAFSRAELASLPQESARLGTTTYRGTRLLNVFNAAGGAKLPNDMNNAKLRVTVRVIGADESEVAFGWGTLDPDFGALPVLVAIEQDGQPLADGTARLIVPGDRLADRSIQAIARIELSDPGPAPP